MNRKQFATLTERLDQIGQLLALIAAGLNPLTDECPHSNTEDHSVMGDAPGARLWCRDCGRYVTHEGDKACR